MPTSDFKLDALLRAVAVPSGLLDRLLMLPYADDAGLDEAVRDVELPEGLLQRLAAIPLADDAGLDEALRNVRCRAIGDVFPPACASHSRPPQAPPN